MTASEPTTAADAVTVGLRREDKNRWERRAPLAPRHVRELAGRGVRVRVQPSETRTFPDADYAAAGAQVDEDLSACDAVLAVKEIPARLFERGRTYALFSHTIKGQPYNMPMLRRLLELGCHLIDYERIVDAGGRRLVAFGRHAGLAGAVETLRALGLRLAADGCPTPLADILPAHAYADVSEARTAIAAVARRIDAGGLPAAVRPLVIGVAGYGNVSAGVQDMLEPLALTRVAPDALAAIPAGDGGRYLAVFEERHIVSRRVSRRDDAAFSLQEYYDHPERYRGVFARYLPHLSVLVNAIYWAPQYPPLMTADDLRALYPAQGPAPRLRVIGDITCDIEGSIPCTVRATSPDAPCYVWDPHTGEVMDGVAGRGPMVMAVDNLPCEFPADATRDFGDALLPFVEPIARAARAGWPRGAADLPLELGPALIACHGVLTDRYRYLAEHLARAE